MDKKQKSQRDMKKSLNWQINGLRGENNNGKQQKSKRIWN